jgi:hypothetical protein
MKTTLGIILGVIAGFIVLTAVIVILALTFVMPAFTEYSNQSTTAPVTGHETFIPPSTSTSTQPAPSSTQKPISTSTTTTSNDVNFSLNILDVSGADLSRTVTAQLLNKGSIDATNCWVNIEVFSSGSRIKINGEEYQRIDLGTLKAGEPSVTQVQMSFSMFDAPRMIKNGVNFNITLYSDQKTQTFSYDYQP